ncbi:hypothetical protein RMATCC62417_09482 [Rhizopus microsporus]|nr:hypothetical protein RMATCC62417_09482 [Rhizopus microsporus]
MALYSSPNSWYDFFNSKPQKGDMGFGRFFIRGSRFINGQYTPFAYPWRLAQPIEIGQYIAWSAYLVHQIGQSLILAKVQLSKKEKLVRWSDDYQWWNWQMVYLNTFMLVFKLIHGHLFYDGLAATIPEGIAQGSVVAILVIAIVIAIPRRGIILGLGKHSARDVVHFVKKYHGYLMSFGTVLNFHYHPVEGTMGHLFGFVYQCLLIWQSTNFLHKSHRNASWTLLLETWVFIHGTLTAIIQPGIGWQIFSYGFAIMFLLNQVYQTQICQSKMIMIVAHIVFAFSMYLGFKNDKAYYRATFIPMTEYACVYLVLGVGNLALRTIQHTNSFSLKLFVILSASALVSIALTVGLAYVLAGNLVVYNDY